MEWLQGVQRAIDYIEENLETPPDYAMMAQIACCSEYNFMRVFSVLSSYTLAEYIRSRRLTLAAQALVMSDIKVIDLALKYGYDTPESFNRAFVKFHGATPSEVRKGGADLRHVSPLKLKISIEGGYDMTYRIVNTEERHFLGYKRRFDGAPSERTLEQEEDFFIHTRLRQYALSGMTQRTADQYMLTCNIDSEGYDFYIASEYDDGKCWLTQKCYAELVRLNPDIGEMFEQITVPAATYAVFETERCKAPVTLHLELRHRIFSEWLGCSGYQLAPGFELSVSHWYGYPDRDKRFIELWLPVES